MNEEYSLSEYNMLKSMDKDLLKSMDVDLEKYRKELSDQLIMKAKRNGLVPIEKQVTRNGKTFKQLVWVKPTKDNQKHVVNRQSKAKQRKPRENIDRDLRAKAKSKVDALKKEHGADELHQKLKNDDRFDWKPNDKPAVDKMRAFMTLREHIEEKIQNGESTDINFDKQKEEQEKQVIDPKEYKFIKDDETLYKIHEYGLKVDQSLSAVESSTVMRYVRNANSFDINKLLYTGKYDKWKSGNYKPKSTTEEKNLKTIDKFSEIIDKHEIPNTMKTVRYVDNNFLNSVFKDLGVSEFFDGEPFESDHEKKDTLKYLLEGVQFKNKSFTSVSYDKTKNVFTKKPVKMEVLIDKGQKGFVTENATESEIVLDKNQQFEFVDFKVRGSKTTIVVKAL